MDTFTGRRSYGRLPAQSLKKWESQRIIVPPNGWMQLVPKQVKHVKEALEIEINGCHVSVSVETDPELLKKVCRTLRSLE